MGASVMYQQRYVHRWLQIGASVMYQHGYMQKMQIILLVPAYGMTDILSLVGDWLVLVGFVGFSWFFVGF